MRPGGLGEVLDRDRDPAVALDQQHVARLQHPPERRDVGVGEGLRPRRRLVELAREAAAEPVRQSVPRRVMRTPVSRPRTPPLTRRRGRRTVASCTRTPAPSPSLRHRPVSVLARAPATELPRRGAVTTGRRRRMEIDGARATTRRSRRCCGRRTAGTSAPTRRSCGHRPVVRGIARSRGSGLGPDVSRTSCRRRCWRSTRSATPGGRTCRSGRGSTPSCATRWSTPSAPAAAGCRCRSRTSPRCCRPRPGPTRPSAATPSGSSAGSTRARRGSCARSASRARACRTSAALDMTETAVRVALHRALKRLAGLRERMIE